VIALCNALLEQGLAASAGAIEAAAVDVLVLLKQGPAASARAIEAAAVFGT